MASGKVHAVASLGLSIPVGALALEFYGWRVGLATALGCAAGVFLSPDLDMEQRTVSETLLYRLHPLVGFPFRAFWFPYAKLFTHRGVSHWPLVGTVTRLAYIAVWAAAVWLVVRQPVIPPFWEWPETWGAVVGLCISDVAHWVCDW